jgi:hypothetical protein
VLVNVQGLLHTSNHAIHVWRVARRTPTDRLKPALSIASASGPR